MRSALGRKRLWTTGNQVSDFIHKRDAAHRRAAQTALRVSEHELVRCYRAALCLTSSSPFSAMGALAAWLDASAPRPATWTVG